MFFPTFLNTKLSAEETSKIVKEIKALSKRPINEMTASNVEQIVSHMRKHNKCLEIQRIAAHALSNMAMNVTTAQTIVQKGGVQPLLKSLETFIDDNKLVWLTTSALWNIARPPINRQHIGTQGAVLCLAALRKHSDCERVTNTIIGALSNLCLLDDIKSIIADDVHLPILMSVASHYAKQKCVKVLTSVSGLIANLAVSDDFGSKMVAANVLPIVIDALSWENTDASPAFETLHRNVCAALNNLVTAECFDTAFLLCEGIEIVTAFVRKNENEMLSNLLENVLTNLNTDSNNDSTSFHLCCQKGNINILKTLIEKQPYFDLNATDGRNMSCLDYSIAANHVECIEFLSRCGAQTKTVETSDDINSALSNGEQTLTEVKQLNSKALEDTLPQFPTDLCRFVVGFSSNIDMLQAVDLF